MRGASRVLLKQIKELAAERNLALSKIAVYEADADITVASANILP